MEDKVDDSDWISDLIRITAQELPELKPKEKKVKKHLNYSWGKNRIIEIPDRKYYSELVEIWESSVRATHDFLTEEDIQSLKPLILNKYFPAVELKCIRDKFGQISGFTGIAEDKIEMLFVSPDSHGKGFGKELVEYSIRIFGVDKVDVNEQNPSALGFYEHMGFRVESRSELDSQGKPFPLLHMILQRG